MTTGTDTVIYTGQITEEELKRDVNKILNEFLQEKSNAQSGDVA